VCRLNDVANPPKRSVTLHTRTKGTGDGCGIRWTRRFSGRKANTRGRCHHKLSCANTTPKTVCKPQSEPKTPWRARCFSGMRWSGCGTALQHPSNRSCVRFADASQHRGRPWYIKHSTQSACMVGKQLGVAHVSAEDFRLLCSPTDAWRRAAVDDQ
jgi:hypothetical protein